MDKLKGLLLQLKSLSEAIFIIASIGLSVVILALLIPVYFLYGVIADMPKKFLDSLIVIAFTMLFVLCMSAITRAEEPIYGYDTLGMAKYCDKVLKAPSLPSLSSLMNTFGNSLNCIEKLAKQNKEKFQYLQMDLIDATCWRNNNCAPGVPKPTDYKIIEARAREVKVTCDIIRQHYNPDFECWVSFALEHDVKNCRDVQKAIDASLKGCPTCKAIQSPFSGCVVPNVPVERHGNKVKSFSVSNDGESIFDSKSGEYRKNGLKFVYAWFGEMNGRPTGLDHWIPPKQRTCWPTSDLMRQAYLVLQPPELPRSEAPTACKNTVNVKEPEILKTNAEAYNPCPHPDPRGNKPLWITKLKGKKGDKLDVLSQEGKKIACFKYYGTFSAPGMHRWYMGDCSGQTPVQLFDAANGEWAFIRKPDGNCVRFNTIRRGGVTR